MSNPKLDIIIGPMFSGKTTKLIEIIDNLHQKSLKYLVIKPNFDNRYNESNKNNFIVSHQFTKRECLIVSSDLDGVFDFLKENTEIKHVLIDEGQFFTNLYSFCLLCLENLNINVVVTGLDGDYKREPIGEILNLIPISDTVTKLNSKCKFCDNPGIFTHRTSNEKNQVLIGGNDKYIPLCRNHYLHGLTEVQAI